MPGHDQASGEGLLLQKVPVEHVSLPSWEPSRWAAPPGTAGLSCGSVRCPQSWAPRAQGRAAPSGECRASPGPRLRARLPPFLLLCLHVTSCAPLTCGALTVLLSSCHPGDTSSRSWGPGGTACGRSRLHVCFFLEASVRNGVSCGVWSSAWPWGSRLPPFCTFPH